MSAKVKLSSQQLSLVTNANIILTKNDIMQQVVALFGQIATEYQSIQPLQAPPKISKGEQYQGLPWVMLDYNAVFTKTTVQAIRTFFWWGNFVSITLHVKHSNAAMYMPAIKQLQQYVGKLWMITLQTENEWNHNLKAYKPLEAVILPETNCCFFKLAIKIPLEKWDNIQEFCTENFIKLTNIIKHPSGEIVL